jgi:hypothetical protein
MNTIKTRQDIVNLLTSCDLRKFVELPKLSNGIKNITILPITILVLNIEFVRSNSSKRGSIYLNSFKNSDGLTRIDGVSIGLPFGNEGELREQLDKIIIISNAIGIKVILSTNLKG